MKTFDVGKLDHRITVKRRVVATSALNERTDTFEIYGEFWASRSDAMAGEAYRAAQVGAQITARFRLRYSPETSAINPVDVIELDGQQYNVTVVREVERNKWIEIDAVRRADG